MKAMIFAAGLGTRLRPLTDHRPKALVEVGGLPLLEIAIRRLKWFGCREIIVNVHHFADQIEAFLEQKQHFGIRIAVSDERALLLDTGGGLKRAAWFFDDGQPFWVCNADILTNLDLAALAAAHRDSGALATVAVMERSTSRYLLFDTRDCLCGWINTKTGEQKNVRETAVSPEALAFSGIHVVSPELFRYFPDKDVFSMIDLYLELAGQHCIRAYRHDGDFLADVGKPERLAAAARWLEVLPLG